MNAKQTVPKNQDSLAFDHYDVVASFYENKTNSKFYSYFSGKLLDRLGGRRFENIFEIGCGTGILTKKLAKKYPLAIITACDVSPNMLTNADRNCSEFKNISFKNSFDDAIAAGPFDLIISNYSYHWWGRSFCENLKKIISDDSTIAISAPSKNTHLRDGNFNVARQIKNLGGKLIANYSRLCGVVSADFLEDFKDINFNFSYEEKLERFSSPQVMTELLYIRGSLAALSQAYGLDVAQLHQSLANNCDGNKKTFSWRAIMAVGTA